MARYDSNKMAWLIDGRSIARKVSRSSAYQIKDCGANRECPKCHCHIDNSDVAQEWPGLPVGVKFDPSDAQLLEHLEAKCAVGNSKPHVFIDEFIPTLDGDKGICYTHPANLPGAKKDGNSVHFFHRTNNAYSTGQRKRRKIHCEVGSDEESVRWHKTGRTKSVIDNGVQKGCKKIMVLYKSSKKGSKPDKSKWVMHQYHLGTDEDEKEGEFVVSKIFYQQKGTERNDGNVLIEDNDILSHQTSPRTPNPNPPRPAKSVMYDDAIADDNMMQLPVQNNDIKEEAPDVPAHVFQLEGDVEFPEWFAGESQAGAKRVSCTGMAHNTNEVNENSNEPCGIAELENLDLDTPPDFHLADLQLGSQERSQGYRLVTTDPALFEKSVPEAATAVWSGDFVLFYVVCFPPFGAVFRLVVFIELVANDVCHVEKPYSQELSEMKFLRSTSPSTAQQGKAVEASIRSIFGNISKMVSNYLYGLDVFNGMFGFLS
ncbi:hypothetical protein OIU78_018237 [Salix suchowensis]|nr:hypothetical protein OIU78_018237 [Salix suchowensis]